MSFARLRQATKKSARANPLILERKCLITIVAAPR
jgi:hypothetical protein